MFEKEIWELMAELRRLNRLLAFLVTIQAKEKGITKEEFEAAAKVLLSEA